MISEHATTWLGFPVRLYDTEAFTEGVPDYERTIHRLALDWDAGLDFPTLFSRFLADPASAASPAIIIGQYHGDEAGTSSEEVVQLLVSAKDKLPRLKAIFIADVISEENEISWIIQSDVSPLLLAYPGLEHLRLRGTGELSLGGQMDHTALKSLTIETGGLPRGLLREVLASHLPALEKLELWLGTPSYGGDVSLDDLHSLLSGNLFPGLKHLGLRDSEMADAVAEALGAAPILERLEALDLSLGTLSDAGGQALLSSPSLKRLKQLDLHYHFLSKPIMAALKQAVPTVNLEGAQDSKTKPDARYVAVSE